MNKKIVWTLVLLTIAALILSGCAAGVRAESTPGITVSGDHVYIAYLNRIHQLDRTTGVLVTNYPEKPKASLAMYAPPAVSEGAVYFGDLANQFQKVVDGNLNQVVWTFSGAKGWYQAKAVIDDELVIVPCNDRNIYALNTENGELVWNYQGEFAFIAEPLIVDDKVIVSAQDHHVLVLNRDTGEELYRVAANGAVVSTPLYDETTGAVYFGSFGKELISFDLETGDINWVFGENRDLATIWGSPVLLGEELIFVDRSGKIIALNPANGEEIWTVEAGGSVVAGLAKVDDLGFLVAREDGNLQFYGLDHVTKWTAKIDGKLYSAPIIDGEQIFLAATKADYILYTYNLTGQPGWSFIPSK